MIAKVRSHLPESMRTHLVSAATLLFAIPALAQVSVLTHHNDNARTGQNLNETILTRSNVNTTQFGMLFKQSLDSLTYGQPLYVANLNIAGGVHNVFYVTTVNNSVYAFDADRSMAAYWHVSLGTPVDIASHFSCHDITGNGSIIGTPVIDGGTSTLYVASLIPSGSSFAHQLHALDLATGSEKFGGPVNITASGFNALQENQRPGLMLLNGVVYIGFASHCDQGSYTGFEIGYNAATLARVGVFNTAPGGSETSIWNGGQPPAADGAGNFYFGVGNGSFNGTTQFGESIVKLSPGFTVLDFFTPSDWASLNSGDKDQDSSGVLLIPGTNMVVESGKAGILYVVNTNAMGHVGGQLQAIKVSSGEPQAAPVYWNSAVNGPMIYFWGSSDHLKSYKVTGATSIDATPFSTGAATASGNPGGVLSISANGNTNGIVWASAPGTFRAYDADDLTSVLWSNQTNSARDSCGSISRYAVPTVANGKVYLGSFGSGGQVCVYGLLSAPPQPDFSLAVSPSSQTVTPGNATTYTVTIGALNGFTGTVTLGLSGSPIGASGSFNPPTVTGSGTSILTVSTTASTPIGTSSLTITGTSGTLSHSQAVALVVSSTPGFSLAVTPASQTVDAGSATSYTATVTPANGFVGTVTVSLTSPPAGVTATPCTIADGSGSCTLNVSTATSTATGRDTLTFTGVSGTISESASVVLTVVGTCVTATAGGGFTNTPFASQTGTFTASFTASVSAAPANDVIGLSSGAQTNIADFPVLVSFSDTGHFVARNGGTYTATNIIPYSAGVTYTFSVVVNVATKTYSVFVTAPGGTQQTVASGFAFRTGVTVTSLNSVGSDVDNPTTSITYCNFTVN